MTQYSNENRGALFKNDRKEKDTHPDYKGSINIDGVEYWLSSWLKTSSRGDKFMSLSVTPKEQQQESRPAQPARQEQKQYRSNTTRPATGSAPAHEKDFEDDIPFASESMYHDMQSSISRRMSRYDF